MKTPKSLLPLIEDGLVDEVLRSLKSGKEATVYVVSSAGEIRCAKVYKDAEKRSFRSQTAYQEGRSERNSRRARAMGKGSAYGRKEQESAWQNAEVEALYRLAEAGVRVPEPYGCFDGVLLMELVIDSEGYAAPRLNDVELTPEQAREYHAFMMMEVVRMLCAGIVHGDLSEFNVLMGWQGPVIIDLPQAVNAAGNNHAFSMLERDVNNMSAYFGQFAPELLETDYAHEIWHLYESGKLNPSVKLTGKFEHSAVEADIEAVLREIEDARLDMERRKAARSEAENE
ncbi:MAG: serine protein kinase RIO [Gammaproteobacteria bacterium]|nr:MAG: serine protein kinase RIO [Gammaproteobacteria bacterium]